MSKPTNHRFKTIAKGGPKGYKGQTKKVRIGARKPRGNGQGSIRRPF